MASLKSILAHRWFRFAVVGLLATASYFLLGLFFYNLLRLPVLLANTFAYILSFIVSYTGQTLWTFKATGSHKKMLPKFAMTQGLGLATNSLLVEAALYLGLPYEAAMLIAAAIVPILVYLVLKLWVYHQ